MKAFTKKKRRTSMKRGREKKKIEVEMGEMNEKALSYSLHGGHT